MWNTIIKIIDIDKMMIYHYNVNKLIIIPNIILTTKTMEVRGGGGHACKEKLESQSEDAEVKLEKLLKIALLLLLLVVLTLFVLRLMLILLVLLIPLILFLYSYCSLKYLTL